MVIKLSIMIKFFFLILILIPIILIGLPVFLCISCYKWLKRKGYKKIAFLPSLLIVGTICYFLYSGIYPGVDFYISDFESNMAMKWPQSAKILKKDTTFPDQHGHRFG